MPVVFRTAKDDPDRREIVGVGVIGANGKGGIPVSHAAESMIELQQLGEDGVYEPLSGSALNAAAKRYAERMGLVLENLKEDEIAKLPQELGSIPDRPPAEEVSVAEYDAVFGPQSEPPAERVMPPAQEGVS